MAKYVSQGIATDAFGIVFRSKLEAQWAYEFTKNSQQWEYADSPWHDFVLDSECHLEIKPLGFGFVEDAIKRAWPFRGEWHEQAMMFVSGRPGKCMFVFCRVAGCGRCCCLNLFSKGLEFIESGEKTYFWNPECGVYGHYCEHGKFHDYGTHNGCVPGKT